MISRSIRFNQPRTKPTFSQASNVGSNGGNINVLGTGFLNQTYGLTVAPWFYIEGLNVSGQCTFSSSTKVVINLPNTYTVGSYNLWIINPDGGYVFAPNGVVVSASSDPSTILGADLSFWYRAADAGNTLSGSAFTGIFDKAANGNAPTSINSLTKTSADSVFNGEDSFTFNGTTSTFSVVSTTLGTSAFFAMMPMYLISAGSNVFFAHLGSNAFLATSASTGDPEMAGATGGTAVWGSSIAGSVCSIYGYSTATASGVSVNNATAITTSSTSTINSGQILGIGAHWTGAGAGSPTGNFISARTPEIIGARIQPSSAQLLALSIYLNLRYQLTPAPSITVTAGVPQVTKVSTSGGSFRIACSNVNTGTTVTLGGGMSAVTVTVTGAPSSSVLECSIPSSTYTAGTYDITITNPDGGATTTSAALTVTATDDVMTIMGTDCIYWVEGDQMTVVSGSVTAAKDKSLLGTDPTTLTAITYTASDSDFNNRPSFAFSSASSSVMKTAVMPLAAASPCFVLVGMKITTPTINGGAWAFYAGTNSFQCDQANTGTAGEPRCFFGSVFPNWASAVSTATSVYGFQTGGTTYTVGVNVGFGTEVTSSTTNTAISANQQFALGAKTTGTNTINAKMCVAIFCRVKPTSTQLTALKAMILARFNI